MFVAPGRIEIQTTLEQLSERKAANLAQIAALTLENQTIDAQLSVGNDTLDFIESEVTLATPSGFAVTSPMSPIGRASATWTNDSNADGYVLERATMLDYSDSAAVYTGAYNVPRVYDGLISGFTYYFRLKSRAVDKEDSDWATASVVVN